MTIRETLEERERQTLSPYASLAARSAGRDIPEEPCDIRTAYQRDRDRILHPGGGADRPHDRPGAAAQ